MTWVKPYKFKAPRKARWDRLERLPERKADELLTGLVQGLPASDLEERFARALDARKLRYRFQWNVATLYSLPGEEKLVDFIVDDGLYYPVEVDAEFTHKGAQQQQYDKMRDAMVDEALQQYGYMPIQRVPGEKLQDQFLSDAEVARLFP